MTAREDLAAIIAERYHAPHQGATVLDGAIADAILAAGYRKPRNITTAEELDALPAGTVIRDGDPLTCTKWASGQWGTFSGDSVGSHRITLPATVLHEGVQS